MADRMVRINENDLIALRNKASKFNRLPELVAELALRATNDSASGDWGLHELLKQLLLPVPCRDCGRHAVVSQQNVLKPQEHFVCCSNCYDGAPDAGRQNTATGRDRIEAVSNWNRIQEED